MPIIKAKADLKVPNLIRRAIIFIIFSKGLLTRAKDLSNDSWGRSQLKMFFIACGEFSNSFSLNPSKLFRGQRNFHKVPSGVAYFVYPSFVRDGLFCTITSS